MASTNSAAAQEVRIKLKPKGATQLNRRNQKQMFYIGSNSNRLKHQKDSDEYSQSEAADYGRTM